MERYTAEQTKNFWSHFPQGMLYRELRSMSEAEVLERASRPAAVVVLASEIEYVQQEYVATPPASTALEAGHHETAVTAA